MRTLRGARRPQAKLALALAALVLTLTGCGLGPGPGTSDVGVTVTSGFGSTHLGSFTEATVPGSETVIQMLERHFKVQTRYGGGFVESVDGHSGSASRVDWFYYVNGIEAPAGAASTAVHRGDRIWWDLHDWSATDSIPAVVGSFPEPFVDGGVGRRSATTLDCTSGVSAACTTVGAALKAAGVATKSRAISTDSGTHTAGILVGTWSQLRAQAAASPIEHGPGTSGVYAEFEHGGALLALLDPEGHVARTLGAGAGLIAATADGESAPTWLVTGTDVAGVSAASRALTANRLRDHFALAVQGSTDLPVPLDGAQ